MRETFKPASLVLIACVLVAGCSSYYKIRDPTTEKEYYTKDYDRYDDGSVEFKDGATKREVTLQNSEIKEIDEDHYRDGIESIVDPPKTDSSGG